MATRVLLLAQYYLPGYRAGGPIGSIAGIAERLGMEFDLRIVTSDRDIGEVVPYESVIVGSWTAVGSAHVLYLPPGRRRLRSLARLLRATPHDVLYLNSLFAPRFGVLPLLLRRLGLIPRVPTIVAPRGELSPEALALGRLRKRAYLHAANRVGQFDEIVWHASGPDEESRIRGEVGPEADVVIAPNIPAVGVPSRTRAARHRPGGPLRVVYLARISPMKNLTAALSILEQVNAPVRFDIYGPIEDKAYWDRCGRILATLPPHVTTSYKRAVPRPEVPKVLEQYDVFLLPTLGESFGVGILEAMAAGCIALISDRTPWRDLAASGAGWELPLEDLSRFAAAIDSCAAKTATELEAMSEAARRVASGVLADDERVDCTRRLFSHASSLDRRR